MKVGGRPLSLACGVAVCLAASSAHATAQQPVPDYEDLVYATVGERTLLVDLYLPEGVDTPPLIAYVHGGAWRGGDKRRAPTVFVAQGYAVASLDFRLSGEAPFPAQIHDIKAGIRFLRAQASRYGFDGRRIAVMGSSSGGHLAALVGVTSGVTHLEGDLGAHTGTSSAVQAIVSYFGASNLTTILDQSTPRGLRVRTPALEAFLGAPPDDVPEVARDASPVFHVDGGDPPLLLLHGDQDPQMPINQSHELEGRYEAEGLDVTFDVVHGAGHGGSAFFEGEHLTGVLAFLRRTIGAEAAR